jgi:hypothetical protein
MLSRFLAVTAAVVALSGCATAIRGTEQDISIITDPPGAKVQISNGRDCVSPCNMKASRDQSLQLTITKEGCQTQSASMTRQLTGAGVLMGGVIDYATGAVYDLEPNPLNLKLVCSTAAVPKS